MNQSAPGTVERPDDAGGRFRAERRDAARTSIIVGGLVAIVGMPTWSVFDYLVSPDKAGEFTAIRLVATALIAIAWGLLFSSFGRRRPELLGLIVIGTVQVAIAAMIVQLSENLAPYALGMSLPIYASSFLLAWSSRYTLVLVAISLASLAVGWVIATEPTGAAEVAIVGFYLLTASAIAVAGQIIRDRAAWREFQTRSELELEQTRTRELVAKLDRLSHEDSLTGLANRRAWDGAIARDCARLARAGAGHTTSVLICDVDQLKEINDSFGHAMGDVVLREVAELLRGRTRAADLVARIGGDEFAVLASDSDEVDAATLANDLRKLIENAELGGSTSDPVTLSIGVAEWDGADDTAEALMLRADRRLYSAKARRNVVCAGDPIEPRRRLAGG